jgi:hypothetical protein
LIDESNHINSRQMKKSILFLLLLLFAISTNAFGQIGFSPAATVSVGASPRDLVVADVNLDGRLDLLTADNGASSVSVRLGDGTGGFSGFTSITVDGPPNNLFVADVNNDGRPDLITSNAGGSNNSISIRLGDGAGNFTGTSVVLLPFSVVGAFGVVVADINLDGQPDYLVGNNNSVYVARGNGTGGVLDTTEFAIASQPRQVAVGDINKDGKPDFVASAAGSNVVSSRVGDGLGGFTISGFANWNIGGGTFPWGVILKDVNRDGNLDFITANRSTSDVTVRFGNGGGSFSASARYTTGAGATRVDAADLDLDGNIDIVSANLTGNTISILRGIGSGSFGTATNISVGNSPQSVVASDVNQDGKPDVLVANSADNTVSVLLNTTSITINPFGAASSVSAEASPQRVVASDVNLDGKPDLLIANASSSSVSVRLGDGLGGFSGTTNVSVGTNPVGLAVADVNLDGRPDILTANTTSNNVSVRLGDGAGGFSGSTTVSVGTQPFTIVVADVNLDGRPDFLTANFAANNISVRLGDGLGGFSGSTNFTVGAAPTGVFVADVNLDGLPDFLATNFGSSSVSVRLGDGLGGFSGTTNVSVGTNPISVFVADVNLDGKPDFVTANQSPNTVSVRLGDGLGGFSGTTTISVGTTTRSVFVADVNLDGKPDLITANRGANSVSIRLGDGTGSFSGTTEISVGDQPLHVFVADVNLDGRPDILTANTGVGNNASVVLNGIVAIPDYTGAPSGISTLTYNNVTFTASGSLPTSTAVTVNGTLTLNGDVDLNGNTITVTNSASGAIAGTGFLLGNGSLVRAFNGDNAYAFPYAQSSNNRSATVAFTSGAGSGNLTYQFFNTAPDNAGLPQTFVGQVINTVAPFYWQITATGTPGTYTLNLAGENTGGVTDVATLRIAKRAIAGNWSSVDAGTGSANAGTIANPTLAQSGIVGFGEFTIGGAGGLDNPLPVTLSAFTGRAVASGVELTWRTSSETDNAGFAILRNGEVIAAYQTVPSLQGQGTTSSETRYSFIDDGVQTGTTYTYRLRSFDLNGTLHDYPNEATVRAESVAPKVYRYELSQNYPNPFNPTTRIKYELKEAGFVSLKVFDMLGREVATLLNERRSAGSYEVTFNAANAASGIYFYRLDAGTFSQTKKMVLVK